MREDKQKFAYEETYLHTEEQAWELIQERPEQFYVYVLINPLNNLPFYVGKGTVLRCFNHWKYGSSKNTYFNNFINKLKRKVNYIFYVFELFTDNEELAYDYEAILIEKFGLKHLDRENNILYNLKTGESGRGLSLNTPLIVKKFKKSHGNKYDYSKVNYRGHGEKVSIICKKHGVFEQYPRRHIEGRGCQECGKHNGIFYDTKSFISLCTVVHDNLYTYEHYEFTTAHGDAVITCKKHGDFTLRAISHYNGQGCGKCHHERLKVINSKSKGPRKNFEERVQDIVNLNPELCYYLKIIKNSETVRIYNTNLLMTCKCLHCKEIFSISPNRLREGRKHSISCSKYLSNSMRKRKKLGKLSIEIYDKEND